MIFIEWLYFNVLKKDWSMITADLVTDNGGGGLLLLFDGSPQALARFGGSTLCPWQYKTQVPQSYWKSKENRQIFLSWIYEKKLNRDWSDLSKKIILENGGYGCYEFYNDIHKLVKEGGSELHVWQ